MEGQELQGLRTVRTTIPAAVNGKVAPPLQQEHVQNPIQQQAQPAFFGDIIMNSGLLSGDNQGTKWTAGNHVDANANANASASASANAYNKNLFAAMTANGNAHSLNDPSIQETLSPFFQPFGIDVAHLPMTNPPIFQSSLTRYDEPMRRRRISISNGQISQLGEDLETVENLYNTQPPPLPQRIDHQQQKQNNYYESAAEEMTPLPDGSVRAAVPHFNVPFALSAIPPWGGSHKQVSNPSQQIIQDEDEEERHEHSEPIMSSTAGGAPMNSVGRQPSSSSSSISSEGTIFGSKEHRGQDHNPVPGTNAWKRARLLERNRIAASKCRQRKKVAQLQLQKDFDILEKENKFIKKKLDYYEKLVSKFKRFSEAHLKKCDGTERETLEIIEEMLMIDSGIREVDDAGLIVKMEEK